MVDGQMTSRELEIFHAVMSSRSLTEAAASLHVSQPALSKAVKRLEDRLRLPLFHRVNGRLRPTPEAESLYPEAARLLREIGSLGRTAMEMRGGEVGLLRVAASASLGLAVVPRAIAAFSSEFPKVKIISHFGPAADIAELVLEHHVDVGVTLSPVERPGAAWQSLASVAMICAVRSDDKLAGRGLLRPRDLAQARLISFAADSHFGRLLDAAFERDGVQRCTAIELATGIQAVPLVLQGAGVAIVDSYMQLAGFSGLAILRVQRH
jgi:DNA-binding transcriptional LysR family regulator